MRRAGRRLGSARTGEVRALRPGLVVEPAPKRVSCALVLVEVDKGVMLAAPGSVADVATEDAALAGLIPPLDGVLERAAPLLA